MGKHRAKKSRNRKPNELTAARLAVLAVVLEVIGALIGLTNTMLERLK